MSEFTAGGRYQARMCGEVVLGKSKEKETPFIEAYFNVTQGDMSGRKVRWTSYFTDATFDRTVDALRTCGWSGNDLSVFSDGALHGLDSNEVEIVVALEDFVGRDGTTKKSVKVQWVNGGLYVNRDAAMSSDDASAFGAMFNDRLSLPKSKASKKDDTPF